MKKKRLGDSKKEHWFVGHYKHVRMENYRNRDLIYLRGGDVTSRVCDPGVIIPR